MPSIDALVTFLPVTDIVRTHAFYHDVVGLPCVVNQAGCRIYHVAGGGYVGFCQREGATVAPRVCVTLVSNNVAEWYDHLTQHGVEIDGPPRDTEAYGIEHFFARDPDGWIVEVQRFHDPAWTEPITIDDAEA